MAAVTLLSIPLLAARTALRLATLPARTTVRVGVILIEDLADMLQREPVRTPEPPPSGAATPGGRSPVESGLFEPFPPEGFSASPPATATPKQRRTPPRRARRDADRPVPEPRRTPPASPARGPGSRREEEPPLTDAPGAPVHVDTEPELVAESADRGAENGAGATLRVDAPWDGYSRMSAPDVIDRIAVEPTAALGVLLLYERSHRSRRTVIAAAERELARRAAAPRR